MHACNTSTYMHMCTYTNIRICVYKYMHTCYACTHARFPRFPHAYMHTCIVCIHTFAHACMHACMHEARLSCMHIFNCMHHVKCIRALGCIYGCMHAVACTDAYMQLCIRPRPAYINFDTSNSMRERRCPHR